jgi:hypothetical protein
MLIDTSSPRSRRAILAGGLGGLVALTVNALGRPRSVAALDGEPMLVGGEYSSSSVTSVTNATGDGLVGGSSGAGIAVTGQGSQGIGVHGFSASNIGVQGVTDSSSLPAVAGRAGLGDGTGVMGTSGDIPLPGAKAKTGVYGHATQDSASRGVWGYSPAGLGVYGESTTGRAVQAVATSGIAVRASVTTGTGCYVTSTSGYALRTDGKVRLDKSAGLATVAGGTSAIAVTPGIDLTTTSAVIATLNGNAGGSTAVKRVAIDTSTNAFTIYLTANATASVRVAWLVVG